LAQRPPARRFFALFMRYWLPVLAYATAVLVVGSQQGLQPPVRFEGADKVYHLLECAGLGYLLVRALRVGRYPASRIATFLDRFLHDERIVEYTPTPEQLAMLARIRTVLGIGRGAAPRLKAVRTSAARRGTR